MIGTAGMGRLGLEVDEGIRPGGSQLLIGPCQLQDGHEEIVLCTESSFQVSSSSLGEYRRNDGATMSVKKADALAVSAMFLTTDVTEAYACLWDFFEVFLRSVRFLLLALSKTE